MEQNTLNEEFNVLWEQALHCPQEDNKDLRLKINELIIVAKKKDSLVLIGMNHPYKPHRIIPVSYDGEIEYITMNGKKILIYRDPRILPRVGGIELSRSRLIVYPSTASSWLQKGTDDQIAFVTKYKDLIGIDL
jgi:hypothetical protein